MSMLGRLYLLFTPELCRNEPAATLQAALDGGVDLVQWRSKRPDRGASTPAASVAAMPGCPSWSTTT
jgi:thiamine monophosphate synthase